MSQLKKKKSVLQVLTIQGSGCPILQTSGKSFYLLLTSSNISLERSHFIFLVLALTNNTVLFLEQLLVSVLLEDLCQTLSSQKPLNSPGQRVYVYRNHLPRVVFFPATWESLLFSFPSFLFWEKMSHSNNVYKSIVPQGCIRKVEIQIPYRYEDATAFPCGIATQV